ncbi:MAG: DUF998 domain-containing protein [Chloroflexi bacterium]|nr:MAG: DUF998 domain-containing protein [Chloroflexota bacterium]
MTTTPFQSVKAIPEGAARTSLAAALLFLVLLASLLVLQPEIDPAWRFISEHALGHHGWLMSIAFLSLAASGVAIAITLWPQVRLGGRIGIGFLMIGALGLTLAGIFTTDPITTPMEAQSTSSQLHGLGALLGDGIAIGAIFITGSLFRNPTWRPARPWMVGALVLVWFAYMWIIVSMPADGNFGPDVPIGWPSRFYLMSYAVWFIVIAWQALRLRKQTA